MDLMSIMGDRPPGERLNRKYVKKTFKSAQVKVMVLGMFYRRKTGSFNCS